MHILIEVISTIAPKDANLDQETLWILKQFSPDSVHFISIESLREHKPQKWEFNIHLDKSGNYGECIESHSYAVHLFREAAESNNNIIKFKPS